MELYSSLCNVKQIFVNIETSNPVSSMHVSSKATCNDFIACATIEEGDDSDEGMFEGGYLSIFVGLSSLGICNNPISECRLRGPI